MNRTWILTLATALLLAVTAAPAHAGWSFLVNLDGFQETPAVASEHSGFCVAVLSDDETELTINCNHDVDNPIVAHIHVGPPGVAGPPDLPFTDPTSPITQTFMLTPEQAADALSGNLYVNVHTPENPGGEIRGQLRPVPPFFGQTMEIELAGAQEVPPVVTDGRGRCQIVLAEDESTLDVTCVHNLDDANAAHIHLEERGVDGDIVVDLGDGSSPIRQTIDLTLPENNMLLNALRAGELYVNVHTPANTEGEIRGQIDACFSGGNTLCLQDNRFRVQVDFETPMGDEGFGHAVPQQANSGSFWFFTPDNLEILIKVLDGCDINDHFWVFFSATTNVGFSVTVTDTLTGEIQSYSNPVGDIAEPVADVSAFETCTP